MTVIRGGFPGGSASMLLALGDGGPGRYTVVRANGANCQSAVTFRCSCWRGQGKSGAVHCTDAAFFDAGGN